MMHGHINTKSIFQSSAAVRFTVTFFCFLLPTVEPRENIRILIDVHFLHLPNCIVARAIEI